MNATERLNRAVAVAQHHDAITGTEKQHVANDYHLRLDAGINNFQKTADIISCPLLNISQCHVTENIQADDVTPVVVYNPLAHSRSALIYLPVELSGPWIVRDDQGQVLDHQVTPLSSHAKQIPGRVSTAQYNLAFYAEQIPPLGIRGFALQLSPNPKAENFMLAKRIAMKIGKVNKVSNLIELTLNKHGLSMKNVRTNETVSHKFGYYIGHPGNNTEFEFRASGAYIFRPLEQEPTFLNLNHSDLYTGPLFTEVHLSFDSATSLICRVPVRPDLFDAEYEWIVGPISIDDGLGKEYISRWKVESEFAQNGIFYTDSNGRQTIKRVRDSRPSYDLQNGTIEEPVSSNYYPINSAIFINSEESDFQLSVVNDRAQGGSSLHDGEVELMLHRRLMDDDAFGVGEPLNEEAYGSGLVAKGKHYVTLTDSIEEGNAKRRKLSNEVFGELIVIFPPKSDLQKVKNLFTKMHNTKDTYELPSNVNLLTFEPWLNASTDYPNKQYLVRIEHLFELGEHGMMSEPVSISLPKFFGPLGTGIGAVSWMRETTLGGNQWKEDSQRLEWNVQGEKATSTPLKEVNFGEERQKQLEDVILEPMEIKTFIVEFHSF